ncbi:MAG: Rrf2 family transcriptional regulator [Treponema sp.]|nr:Rrf2 family transcriptional regulator [Treponema sp.]
MKISSRGRYALRFMIYLALHSNGNFIALKDVSDNEGISIKYLEQITGLLSKNGLLLSVRGPAGGYKLSKAADQYTAGEILRVTEGDLSPVAADESDGNLADGKERANIQPFWDGLQKAIDDYLDGVTLQDLLEQSSGKGNFMYVI